MNSILNRYRQIKSGTVSPAAWGVFGKTKDEVTLSDIIKAPDQYSPIKDGSFDQTTSEQGLKALNNAIAGGGLDPQKIYENLLKAGVDRSTADVISRADSFSNPAIRSNPPFPGRFETGAVKDDKGQVVDAHSFQAIGYTKKNERPTAYTQTSRPAASKNTVAANNPTSNLGLDVGEKSAEFTYKGQKFQIERINDANGETRFKILADTGNIFGKDNVSSQAVGKKVWELVQRVSAGDLGKIKFGDKIDKPSTQSKTNQNTNLSFLPKSMGGDQPLVSMVNLGGTGVSSSNTFTQQQDNTNPESAPDTNNTSSQSLFA
jgi:hypothetical protein